MKTSTFADLHSRLVHLDGRGYPAYKNIKGRYAGDNLQLLVDHVQGDPFATPSRVRIRVSMDQAGFPAHTLEPAVRRMALRDFLARSFAAGARAAASRTGSGKSGMIAMDPPGQEILERSSIHVTENMVEARFVAGLPARGRRILGRRAAELLCRVIPGVALDTLFYAALDTGRLTRHLDAAEDADTLRNSLADRGLAAFVADGAVLPRRSGVDDAPMEDGNVVPFASPPSLRTTFHLPHAGTVSGLGIPLGVTLIVGGGYHGKSTLLQAIERGVYTHVPGDGRELVVTDPTTVKIRAEDGRPVAGVDIRPFIHYLPGGSTPDFFCTANASGSTSQAANIVEALEAGARLLLLDEDTCATNLMIRDARMQALVEKSGEPITPFLDRVRQLSDSGVSTILVLGGSGDYFEVADTVIRLDTFRPRDVTEDARHVAQRYPSLRRNEANDGDFAPAKPRCPLPSSMDPRRGKKAVSIKAHATRAVHYGKQEIDVSRVAQLVDNGQVTAIGKALELARQRVMASHKDMPGVVRDVMNYLADNGLDALASRPNGDFVAFRAYEFAAALNRLRSLEVTRPGSGP